ncbi:MAG: hypothetical protein EAZ92_15160 [Candidatus Kapaibacterium sp.]|nr:MAG: hypothetical protein EAZ92_15160 [Candidatus Kapabacteria bacterium]
MRLDFKMILHHFFSRAGFHCHCARTLFVHGFPLRLMSGIFFLHVLVVCAFCGGFAVVPVALLAVEQPSAARPLGQQNLNQDSLSFQHYYQAALLLSDPKPDSALILSRKAEIFARKRNNPREISLSLSVSASALTDIDKSPEAMQEGRTALFLAKKANDTLALAWALFAIGYASGQRLDGDGSERENSKTTLHLLLEGLRYSLKAGDINLTTNYYNGIGRIYRKIGMFDSALVFHQGALAWAKKSGNLVQEGWASYSVAMCYDSQSRLKEALHYAQKSVEIRKNVGNDFPIALSLGGVALILGKLGETKRALEYAKESLVYADRSGLSVTRASAMERIATLSAASGDYRSAYTFYQRYAALRDSIIAREQGNDVRSLAHELEIERSKKEKAELVRQQTEQNARFRQQTIVAVAIAVVAVLLLIIIIAILRLQRITRQKQRLAEQYASSTAHTNARLDQMNQELLKQNHELEQVSNERAELIHIVAHDLKNPISAINGFAELFQDTSLEAEKTAMIAERIVAISNRMLQLVTNLLDMSRLESGGMHFHLQACDILPLAENTLLQYQTQAAAKNIRIYVQSASSHPLLVIADEQAILQVLDNLVSNAIKYSPHGKNIVVRIKASTDAVRVEVQDEGPGISGEDMKKLFGKFVRLSARPTGDEHSTGLGLSIVKKMVEAMNGRVWCESDLGKGATFIVELSRYTLGVETEGSYQKRVVS